MSTKHDKYYIGKDGKPYSIPMIAHVLTDNSYVTESIEYHKKEIEQEINKLDINLTDIIHNFNDNSNIVGCVSLDKFKTASLLFENIVIPFKSYQTLSKHDLLPQAKHPFIFTDMNSSNQALATITSVGILAKSILVHALETKSFTPIDEPIPESLVSDLENTILGYAGLDISNSSNIPAIHHVLSYIYEREFYNSLSQTHSNTIAFWNSNISRDIFSVHDSETKLTECQLWNATLSNIPMVIENRLTWEQVIEFRNDTQNRTKYLELKHWLKDGIKATSESHAKEIIELKIENYKNALNKHNIETKHGIMSAIVNPKSIFSGVSGAATSALAIPNNPMFTLAAAGTSYTLGVGIELFGLKAKKLDIQTLEGREVAYLHEISGF